MKHSVSNILLRNPTNRALSNCSSCSSSDNSSATDDTSASSGALPIYQKENRNGSNGVSMKMVFWMRFRRSFLLQMSMPGMFLATMTVLLVMSNSSRSIITSDTTITTNNSNNKNVKSAHRHPFIRPSATIRSDSRSSNSLSQEHRSLFSRLSGNDSSEAQESQEPPTEPRYLVFGTSTTYGVGLENPLKEAYPYRISVTTNKEESIVHNAATRNGGFTMAAACTESIVGDNTVYDIIILEFQYWEPALTVLTQRLRQRFPQALIVFLRLWRPNQLQYQHHNGTRIDFQTYRWNMVPTPALSSEDSVTSQKRTLDDPELYLNIYAEKDQWSFEPPSPEDEATVVEQASRYSASYFSMNVPEPDIFDYPKTMMDQLSIFDDEFDANLNAQGHAVVAASLQSVIQEALGHQNNDDNTRDVVGSWGAGDECRLWYENGLYHSDTESQRLRKVEFDKASKYGSSSSWLVSPDHKHAMEVDSRRGSTLKIANPFDTDRMLYLSYLAAPMASAESRASSERRIKSNHDDDDGVAVLEEDFAKLRVRINNKPAVMIEAWHNDVNAYNQELARTTAVGMVPPGTSTIHLDPLLMGTSTTFSALWSTSSSSATSGAASSASTRPFQLLGWSLLSQEVEGILSLEYSLEESRVPVEDYWDWFSR